MHAPISSAILPLSLHLNPTGQPNPAIPPHSHWAWHIWMQNSDPIPAHGLPQSFQLPFASAHSFLVMPSKPPQSAAQPFSFSLPWQTLSPQKGSVLGASWGLQPAIRSKRRMKAIFFIFRCWILMFLMLFIHNDFISYSDAIPGRKSAVYLQNIHGWL